MASTYENDLRLEEMATGENSGSWGTKTNTNLELIADAFSYGTETIANADTTITIADGAADAARSLALKINSSEDLTTTRVVTLAPNTTSKVWIIENNTSGGQTLTISAGSGSNITLANGKTKIIATDGIGAGSNVVELTQDLAIADLFVDDDLTVGDDIIMNSDGAKIDFGSDSEIHLTHVADTGLLLTETGGGAPTLQFRDNGLAISSSADGQLDIDSDGTIDINATTSIAFDTNTLYVDSANNRVGVGTASPATLLHLNSASDTYFTIGTTNATADARIQFRNSGGTDAGGLWYATSGNSMQFRTNSAEAMRIDSSQRVLIGTSSSINGYYLQVAENSGYAGVSALRYTNDAFGAYLNLGKSRTTTIGGNTIVQDNDVVGYITFSPNDGTDLVSISSQIQGEIDGTPGANDVPGRLVFKTTADGASSATERMRITSSGNVGIASGGDVTLNSTDIALQVGSGSLSNPTIQIRSSSSGTGQLWFGDNSGSDAGRYDGFIQYNQTDRFMYFGTAQSNALRIDSDQRTIIGGYSLVPIINASVQASVVGGSADSGGGGLGIARFGGPPIVGLASSPNTTVGSYTLTSSGTAMGYLYYGADDGTDLRTSGAYIAGIVDGTPGANDMPGRLVFATTADGASSSTERLRIQNDGHFAFGYPDDNGNFYRFYKSPTDYDGDFAVDNMGMRENFRFYQGAARKWFKVFERSFQTPNQFGHQAIKLVLIGTGSTSGNAHHAELLINTKQQQANDGYEMYRWGNGGFNVNYKFDATGGHDNAGLLTVWAQPSEQYVTSCLWAYSTQSRGDSSTESSAWFGIDDTGSEDTPSGSTAMKETLNFEGITYTEGGESYSQSTAYKTWDSQVGVNRHLDLGGLGTGIPTVGGSDNQVATLSGTSNRASFVMVDTVANTGGASIKFAKGRSGTINSFGTAANDGDEIGVIIGYVDDGTDANHYGQYINFAVDGTVGTNDVPGRIGFATTADGASSSSERLTLPNEGGIIMTGSSTPVGSSGSTLQFQTGTRTVSSSTSATVTLFTRSPDANVSSTGTCYVAAENSGGSVQFGYIIDFFYSNGTLQTTARETGSSQGTTTATIAESGNTLSITVTYGGGLGGNIRFNAGGTAVNCSY